MHVRSAVPIRGPYTGVWFRYIIVNAPPDVATHPVARRRPAARRAMIVAGIVVLVSIIRPWGDGSGPATGPPAAREPERDAPAVAAPATPSPAPSLASDQIACSAADWQLVSLDHLGKWTVRSWLPTAAVRAVGPLDATIRPVTLESPEVLAIGACSPATVDGAGRTNLGGPTQVIRAWRVSAGRATPLALATHRDEVLPGVATLYRPEATIAARDAGDGWPAGDFVLEVVPVGQADGRADPGSGQDGLDGEPAPAPGWFVGLVVRGHG